MIEGLAVQNKVLDLVLTYMTDMSVQDLEKIQMRVLELVKAQQDATVAEEDPREAS